MRSQDAILFPAVIKKSNPLFIEYKLPDLAHTNLSVHCLFVCLFFFISDFFYKWNQALKIVVHE